MIPKYTIEYRTHFRNDSPAKHYSTDDPVACEEFAGVLLDGGFPICVIKHEGVELTRHEFDKIIRTAAAMIASKKICDSLRIKPEEERFRFGFTA